MRRLKLLIADDHPVVLFGLKQILSSRTEYELVGQAHQAGELLRLIAQHSPDVLITDYDMPGDAVHGDGLRLISYLRRQFPDLKIIILTVVQSQVIIAKLWSLGVLAVLSKMDDMSEILAALRAVQDNRRYSGPAFEASRPARAKGPSAADRIHTLTMKELEILRHLMSGSTVTVVAATLQRSVKTVSAQKMSAMRKLDVSSDHELVMFCLQHKIFAAS